MARLLWLADVLRAAGLTVHEVDGWRTRGSDSYGPVRGVIYHATADKANSGPADARDDAGAVAVIRDGRPGLAGPIACAYVNREGDWFLIAAGRCNTVKTGVAGPLKGIGNSNIVGVEAENDNRGEPWPEVQLQSLRVGFAAILDRLGLSTARLAGHYEHQPPPDKSDPFGIDMNVFRAQVAAAPARLEEEDEPMANTWTEAVTQNAGRGYLTGQQRDTVLAIAAGGAADALSGVQQLLAAAAADEVRDTATLAAVQALAVATGVDPTPILAAIADARAETHSLIVDLQQQLAQVQARNLKQAQAMAAAGMAFESADD